MAFSIGKSFNKKYVQEGRGTLFNRLYAEERQMLAPTVRREISNIPDMTSINQMEAPEITQQHIGAFESGEDQITGRVIQQLQRNEDIDQNLYNNYPRVTTDPPGAGIDEVASHLPDGLPADQAEGLQQTSASKFLANARERISRVLDINPNRLESLRGGREGVAASTGRMEKELMKEFGPEAYNYGPKTSARRQALELYASTGDPELLETVRLFGLSPATFEHEGNLSSGRQGIIDERRAMEARGLPSENLIPVIAKTGTMINLPGVGRVDLADIRRPVVTEDTALAAEDWVNSQRARKQENLLNYQTSQQATIDEILAERKQMALEEGTRLAEQQNMAIANGRNSMAQEMEPRLKILRSIYLDPTKSGHREGEMMRLQGGLRTAERNTNREVQGLTKKYPTTLMDWSGESKRLFAEFDENGNIIPGTEEIRAERRAMDLPSKGGGGRNIAEYTANQENIVKPETPILNNSEEINNYNLEQAVFPWWKTDEDNSSIGRKIDIYGIRPSNIRKDLDYKIPSSPNYTKEERDIFLSGQSDTAKNRQRFYREYETQPVTPQGIRSIPVSSELVRLQRTGAPGEAQAFLDRLKKEYMNG